MSDNTLLNSGTGGDTLRTLEDGSSIKWPVGVTAYATSVGTPDVLTIPVAAALADNTANPTTILHGALLHLYDGANWDLGRGDSTNGLLVNLGLNNDVTLAVLPDTTTGDLAAIRASLAGTLTVGSHAVTNAGTFAVQAAQSGTWNITNISGTVSLPTGAATAAKQPALGTAGTASADVITVQGIASMTALKVDGSAVTQPVSDGGGSLTVDGTVAATQSGTWTVQPGNTANTTAWLVTGTGGTFPVTDSGGSLTIDNAALSVTGGGVEASALRVTIATDSSGVLSVDDNGSTLSIDDGGSSITIDGTISATCTNSGTFAVQESGTALTRLTDIETNTDYGATTGNGAAAGSLRVTLANDSTGVLATVSTVTTVSTLTGGGVAHDGADSGNPHKVGAKATTSLSGLTLVADADRTNLFAGVDGVLLSRPHANLEDIVSGNASNTDGTSTQCIAAQSSGIKTYLTTIILTNTSATMIYVEIKDGTTVKLTIPVPATGGAVVNLPVPLPGTAATAWNFDPSAATTTVYCSMMGFKSKV